MEVLERFFMKRSVLIGLVVISLFLFSYTIGVAENGNNEDQGILLEEHFDEKSDSWVVLKGDIGCEFAIDNGTFEFLDKGASWQFKIPFSKEPPSEEKTGDISCEFRYNVTRARGNQDLIIGLGFDPYVAAVSLNSTNLAYENADGWDNENRALPAEKGKWHSVQIVLGDNAYDVYLDGKPVGLGILLLAKAETVNCVAMWTNPDAPGHTGIWHIDELIVSMLPFAVKPSERLATIWGELKAEQ